MAAFDRNVFLNRFVVDCVGYARRAAAISGWDLFDWKLRGGSIDEETGIHHYLHTLATTVLVMDIGIFR